MALPIPANTTCVIYRAGQAPPSPPDVGPIACLLQADYAQGLDAGEGDGLDRKFTHVLWVEVSVDVRDDYSSGVFGSNSDVVYVPDENGTAFAVRMVQRHGRGTPQDHKRVYLARKAVAWPSEEV